MARISTDNTANNLTTSELGRGDRDRLCPVCETDYASRSGISRCLECKNELGTVVVLLGNESESRMTQPYCWVCYKFPALIRKGPYGSVTMVELFDDDTLVWSGCGFTTSRVMRDRLQEIDRTAKELARSLEIPEGNAWMEQLPDPDYDLNPGPQYSKHGCIDCNGELGQISMLNGGGLVQVVPYCYLCNSLQPWCQRVGDAVITHRPGTDTPVFVDLGWTTPRRMAHENYEKQLKILNESQSWVNWVLQGITESFDEPLNANGQDEIGMLGSGASKGDGVRDAYSRRGKKAAAEGKAEESDPPTPMEGGPVPAPRQDLNSGDPRRKVWKVKPRGSKSKNLVNTQLINDVQYMMGENDAFRERLKEVSEQDELQKRLEDREHELRLAKKDGRIPLPPDPPLNSPPPNGAPPKKEGSHKQDPLPICTIGPNQQLNFYVYVTVIPVAPLFHLVVLFYQWISFLMPTLEEATDLFVAGFHWIIPDVLMVCLKKTFASLMWKNLLTFEAIYPHLVLFLLCILYLLVLRVNLYSRWRGHRYTSLRDLPNPVPLGLDGRADVLGLADLKHTDPLLHEIMYEHGYLFRTKQRVLTISLEILSQCAISRVLDLGYDEKLVWQHIRHVVNNYQHANLPRELVLKLLNVGQDTQVLAFGLWKHMQQERADVLFPRTQ